jgi:DNA polymerase I-like protein with 3'-5' exonuclease and polymerase domains
MKFHLIVNREQLQEAVIALEGCKYLALQIQSDGPDPLLHPVLNLALNANREDVWLIDFSRLPTADDVQLLSRILEDRSVVKVMYKAKQGIRFLRRLGLKPNGTWFDPYLAAQILTTPTGPASYDFGAIAKFYLDYEAKPWIEYGPLYGDSPLLAFAQGVSLLLPLRSRMVQDLISNGLVDVAKLEFDCVHAVVDMEETGMYLNAEAMETLGHEIKQQISILEERLLPFLGQRKQQMNLLGGAEVSDINLDSPEQLRAALQRKGIAVQDTNRHTLNRLAQEHPEVADLLEYRKLSKQLNTFIETLPKFIHPVSGRVHSHYEQVGSSSGRFSCSSPNIQQTPRDFAFRACWQAPPGRVLVIADYSQIELRVAAEMAQDARMIKAYQQGEDLHRLTASLVSGVPMPLVDKQQRQAAKAINFGLIFAMGARGLQSYAQDTYGVEMSMQQAEQFRQRFFQAYRGIERWHKRVREEDAQKRRDGLPSETRTLTGRRYIWSGQAGVAGLYNMPVQGSAADITKKALGLIMEENRNPKWHLIACVHDEILMEVPEEQKVEAQYFLQRQMERAGKAILRSVPVVAESNIGHSWAEAK